MKRRRFFQVSIRTLLILTTLVAIGLAYFNHIRRRVQEQKTAAARIVALGGKVTVRPPSQVWPWLRKVVGDEYFQEVVAVELDETLVTDADLKLIGKLRGMKSLSLKGVLPGARYGYHMPRLRHNPNLLPSEISSDGILRLGPQQNLEKACLANNPIKDEAMDTIASWPQLKSLDLQSTKVTSRGIERLGKLERIKSLNLCLTKIDDNAVPTLCQMRSLQELDVGFTAVSGNGLLRLREELPACKLLGAYWDLSAGIDPDPESMRWKEITRPMWDLSRRGELKLLVLAGTAVTDLHLKDLDRLESTDVIDLRRTKVTDGGIAALQRALPKCKIVR